MSNPETDALLNDDLIQSDSSPKETPNDSDSSSSQSPNQFIDDEYLEQYFIDTQNIKRLAQRQNQNFFRRNFSKFERGSMRFLVLNWLNLMSSLTSEHHQSELPVLLRPTRHRPDHRLHARFGADPLQNGFFHLHGQSRLQILQLHRHR